MISDLRGGRNDTDPSMALRPDQAVEMLNVHWKDTPFAAKRGGSTAISTSGGTDFGAIQTLIRHEPGSDPTLAELWGVDAVPIVKRLTGGTSFANVTLDDAIATRPQDVVGASLNGKLFLAYDSSVDRLHVYDPGLASARVRRVGLAVPGAQTSANSGGGGAYAAVLRYIRVRWVQLTGTVVTRRSEPPSTGFSTTPSGANASITYTRPTAPGEGETHWDQEVSLDGSTWYVLSASIAIATTTYVDTAATTTYSSGALSDPVGMYALFPSVKYLVTDGNRLLGAGAWETAGAVSGGKNSRVWFTPVLGAADKGDDERVPNQTNQKNWIDLNENDGGGVTGMGTLNGVPVAFKYRQVYKLTPTGDVTTPYLPKRLRTDIGCISHKSIAVGDDHLGNPALYFMSHRGPYRVTVNQGIQYLGRDNEVMWRSLNLGASSVVTHSIYYPELHQWWVWISTVDVIDPDVKMMFDSQKGFPDENGQIRGGWTKHTGDSAGARCSTLFSNTIAAAMSRDLKPYIGRAGGTQILKCDTTDLDDAGADFQAYVKTRPVITNGALGRKHGLREPFLEAKVLTGVTVTLTTDRDFGAETRTHTMLLTATAGGTETRAVKKFEGGEVGEADVIQMQVGDGVAQKGAWVMDALIVLVTTQEWK